MQIFAVIFFRKDQGAVSTFSRGALLGTDPSHHRHGRQSANSPNSMTCFLPQEKKSYVTKFCPET